MKYIYITLLMALLTPLVEGCSTVTVNDFQECSPIPNFESETPPDFGAVCDNFLKPNQLILNHEEWVATQKKWIAAGNGVDCVPSSAVGDLKREVEKLCSVAKCDYATKAAVAVVVKGLERIQATAALTLIQP